MEYYILCNINIDRDVVYYIPCTINIGMDIVYYIPCTINIGMDIVYCIPCTINIGRDIVYYIPCIITIDSDCPVLFITVWMPTTPANTYILVRQNLTEIGRNLYCLFCITRRYNRSKLLMVGYTIH